MARIRTIKPEFFTSADIVDLTPLARLFYVSLWCEADREGRLNWNVKTLKMRYLPGDDCDIEGLANELIAANLIYIYVVNGREYAEIPSFAHHQVINNRESDSIIPENPNSFDASTTRESGVQAEGKEGRKGKEGKGRESASTSKARPKDSQEVEQYAHSIGYKLDGQKFINHYDANGWMRGKNKIKDWRACVRTWKQNDEERNGKQETNKQRILN